MIPTYKETVKKFVFLPQIGVFLCLPFLEDELQSIWKTEITVVHK